MEMTKIYLPSLALLYFRILSLPTLGPDLTQYHVRCGKVDVLMKIRNQDATCYWSMQSLAAARVLLRLKTCMPNHKGLTRGSCRTRVLKRGVTMQRCVVRASDFQDGVIYKNRDLFTADVAGTGCCENGSRWRCIGFSRIGSMSKHVLSEMRPLVGGGATATMYLDMRMILVVNARRRGTRMQAHRGRLRRAQPRRRGDTGESKTPRGQRGYVPASQSGVCSVLLGPPCATSKRTVGQTKRRREGTILSDGRRQVSVAYLYFGDGASVGCRRCTCTLSRFSIL